MWPESHENPDCRWAYGVDPGTVVERTIKLFVRKTTILPALFSPAPKKKWQNHAWANRQADLKSGTNSVVPLDVLKATPRKAKPATNAIR